MTPEERLAQLGYTLNEAKASHPAMHVGTIVGNLMWLSGSITPPKDGVPWKGRVGETYTVEEGYEAARLCAVAQLAAAKTMLGELSRIKRVVKVLGLVNCAPDFTNTSGVIHGFSELLVEALGEDAGRHARSAIGVQALPNGVPVEVETIFEIS